MSRVYNYLTGSNEGKKERKEITIDETSKATMLYHMQGSGRAEAEMKKQSNELARQVHVKKHAIGKQQRTVQKRENDLAAAREKVKTQEQELAKLACAWELEEDRLKKELEEYQKTIQKKISVMRQEHNKNVIKHTNLKSEANVEVESLRNIYDGETETLTELFEDVRLVEDEKSDVDDQLSLLKSLLKVPMPQRPLGSGSGATSDDWRDAIKVFIPHEDKYDCARAIWKIRHKSTILKAIQLLKLNGVEEAKGNCKEGLPVLRGKLVKVLFPDDVEVVQKGQPRSPSPDTKRERMVAQMMEESKLAAEAKEIRDMKKRKREFDESMTDESEEEEDESKSKKRKVGIEDKMDLLKEILSPEQLQRIFGEDAMSAPVKEGNSEADSWTEDMKLPDGQKST